MPKRSKPERKYLTKTVVDAALPYSDGKRDKLIWDTDKGRSKGVSGFALKVRPSGHKTFIFQYRYKGLVRRYNIGTYGGGLTVQQARDHAKTLRAKLPEGKDPHLERVKERRQDDAPLTLGKLCIDFLENHAKHYKRRSSWKEDERRLKRYVIGGDDAKSKDRPAIGKQIADTVTEAQIDTLAREIGKRAPIESNRVLVLLATVYAWAIRKSKLPGTLKNPAKRRKRDLYPEQPRARILKTEERPKLLEAIEAEPNPYHRALFKLLLLTGLRKSELLNAKYKDLDLGEMTLELPKTKSGRPRTVPLSDEAVQTIRELAQCVGNDYLFPAHRAEYRLDRSAGDRKFHLSFRSGNKPMSAPKKQWSRVRKVAGCDDLRIHDLRRTASVMVLKATGNPKTAQNVLGHADVATTIRHYTSVTADEERAAVEVLARAITEDQ